jgi:hypothetical protein
MLILSLLRAVFASTLTLLYQVIRRIIRKTDRDLRRQAIYKKEHDETRKANSEGFLDPCYLRHR